MSKKPRSLWATIGKILLVILLAFVGLCLLGIVYGIAKRGLFQEEFLSYPFAQIPVILPRDHAAHNDYKNEWWYYTGHLAAADGHKYGFELTFFRKRTPNTWYNHIPVWWFMYPYGMAAHMAISDKDSRQHYLADRLQKNSSDNVGAKTDEYHVWFRDWYVKAEGESHHLYAADGPLGLDLMVKPLKPAVLHGLNGYHWKGVDGIPSYYISYLRQGVTGNLTVDGKSVPVTGQSWMDHEYSSFRPKQATQGWDWFAIQLDNNTEIMLYQMRRTDGSFSTDSTGTLVGPDGIARSIVMPDFQIKSTGTWTSPRTTAAYPMGWVVTLPDENAALRITPSFTEQEMVMPRSDIVYWEGAADIGGTWKGQPITGLAYVELTGYLKPVAERF